MHVEEKTAEYVKCHHAAGGSPKLKQKTPRQTTHLDRVGKGKSDSQGQAFRNSYHQDSHTDDEVLDKGLDVARRRVWRPCLANDGKLVDTELDNQDDDSQHCNGRS